MIWETFLPLLFFVKSETLSTIVGTLSTMLVKKSGLKLLNPLTSANYNYLSLQRARTDLNRYVKKEGAFSNATDLLALRE